MSKDELQKRIRVGGDVAKDSIVRNGKEVRLCSRKTILSCR